jgi:hypothetical protein
MHGSQLLAATYSPARAAHGLALLRPACPVCGEPRADIDGRFCEVCRYDFADRTPGPAPAASPQGANAPSRSTWLLVLTVDRSLDTEPDPSSPPPLESELVFAVEQPELLVGRRDDKQNIRPAIPLHDPGASRRHAKFLLAADGTVSLHDLGSTNGTKLNGLDVVAGSIRELKEGDEVTLGRWTRIVLRARP